jgi:molecular chaperone HtpG
MPRTCRSTFSREILQQNRDVDAIRAGCVKRVLGLLDDLAANQADKYTVFWREFGRAFKEGAGEDAANRDRIAEAAAFLSTHAETEEQTVSLADYVSPDESGPGPDLVRDRGFLRRGALEPAPRSVPAQGDRSAAARERVDEWLVAHLTEFEGKKLASVARGGLDLGDLADSEEKKSSEEKRKEFRALVEKMKEALGERVKEVRARRSA